VRSVTRGVTAHESVTFFSRKVDAVIASGTIFVYPVFTGSACGEGPGPQLLWCAG